MPGIRIQHSADRSCGYTVVDGSRPYRAPWACPTPPAGCGGTHQFKTYHLRLDESGAVIVSTTIWERLQRIPGQPFHLGNEVVRPPVQVVRPTLLLRQLTAIAPGGTHGQAPH